MRKHPPLTTSAPGVPLHSLTISLASGSVVIAGGPIALQSGGTISDTANGSATDSLPGIALNGPATFAISSSSRTLQVSGAIAGASGITETGSGTLILAGSNGYSGGTTVGGGTLDVTGSLSSSAVTVGSGARLTGTGTVLSIAVQSGGTLSGTLTATDGTTFASGSIFDVTIDSATTFTQLRGGTTDLNAGPTLNVTLAGGFSPATGTTFHIIPGSVSGTFAGLSNGATLTVAGTVFRINYASATLTVAAPVSSVPAVGWPGLMVLAILLGALGTRFVPHFRRG
jgi:autotransporter-associated beta strand protein